MFIGNEFHELCSGGRKYGRICENSKSLLGFRLDLRSPNPPGEFKAAIFDREFGATQVNYKSGKFGGDYFAERRDGSSCQLTWTKSKYQHLYTR